MNKVLLFILLAWIFIQTSFAQNKIDQYEYWFDADFSAKVSVSVPAVSNLQLNTSIPANLLGDGLHTFHIRFRDLNNRYTSATTSFFIKQSQSATVSSTMKHYEYWFDQDHGNSVEGVLPSNQLINFNDLIAAHSLNSGLHIFHIRLKDAYGKWSSISSNFFLIPQAPFSVPSVDLSTFQYWFDSDYSGSQLIQFSGNSLENIVSNLDASNLNDGLHTLQCRAKDITGRWSSVLSYFFLKIDTLNFGNVQLKEYEYWFDQNDLLKVNVAMNGTGTQSIIASLDASVLMEGLHTLYIRFKDENSKWSSVTSHFFIKVPSVNLSTNNLTQFRYWFDQDEANMVTRNVPGSSSFLMLEDTISLVQVPKGYHTLQFQFQDHEGQWSSVISDTIYKNSLPIAAFNANDTAFCDSAIVAFTNQSIDGENFFWDFGDGQQSTDENPSHQYSNPGMYTVTLRAEDPMVALDSTVVLTQFIEIYETPEAVLSLVGNDSICLGSEVILYSSSLGEVVWSEGTTNDSLFVNAQGNYFFTIYNSDYPACYAVSSDTFITVLPLPEADFSFSNNDHLVTFTNISAVGDSYYWFFGDGMSSTDFSPSHDYLVNGIYQSYLVSSNFCGTDTAFAVIDLSTVSTEIDKMDDEFYLFPIPSRAEIFIQLPEQTSYPVSIKVYDDGARLISSMEGMNPSYGRITWDASAYEDGLYFIEIIDAHGSKGTLKAILQR